MGARRPPPPIPRDEDSHVSLYARISRQKRPTATHSPATVIAARHTASLSTTVEAPHGCRCQPTPPANRAHEERRPSPAHPPAPVDQRGADEIDARPPPGRGGGVVGPASRREKEKEDKNLPFLFLSCPCRCCTKSPIFDFIIVEVL